MGMLAKALREEHWELAALCLLLGALRAVRNLPPDSVTGLLEALEGGEGNARQRTS